MFWFQTNKMAAEDARTLKKINENSKKNIEELKTK